MDTTLTHVSSSILTGKGLIESSWNRNLANEFTLTVQIPVNTDTAEVYFPKFGVNNLLVTESNKPVWQNGKFVPGVPGVLSASDAGKDILFTVGSGRYQFYAKVS